jgi:hypothetical protein
MKTSIRILGLGACLGLAIAAAAGPLAAKEKRERTNAITQSDSFLAGHPDLRWRTEGVESYGKGNYEEALKRFKRAARYADKPSQAMVAEMYWRGEGVPMDRALGYVWIELAAERGYRDFLVKREYFWKNMTREEQQRALTEGLALFDEYGDAVAKPRIVETLRRARAQTTGSRTGHVGALTVMISNGAGGFMTVDGSQFYASKYWEPKEYFEWQEKVWEDLPRGQVDVGELQVADQAASTAGPEKK